MEKRRKWKIALGCLLGILLCSVVLIAFLRLLFSETLSQKSAERYEVRGVDVSYYQGEIDWEILASQVDFAYIKATEGSSHVDVAFERNMEEAMRMQLPVGAYHFFSFESSGETQAENYIRVVGNRSGMLIPVVDVEYYSLAPNGDLEETVPFEVLDVSAARRELQVMLDCLEAHYGVKPMIYVTMSSYYHILGGEFAGYPIWIRNTYFEPMVTAREWTFWQYCDKGILEGYDGEEYIDLNVFYGSREMLEEYRIR